VLREVVAIDGRAALHSMPSALFEAPSVAGSTLDWQQLPTLKVDPADPMASWLAGVSVDDPAERVAALGKAPEQTIEVRLAIARAAIDFGMTDLATQTLGALLDENPWEWRAVWLAGLAELSAGNTGAAVASFNTVYGQVPGELAPKLALALACELNDDVEIAAALYTVCARSDAAYSAAAAFGLGRIRAASGDIGGALSALDLVAPTSRSFVDARRQRAELLVDNHRNLGDLSDAARSLDSVPLESRERLSLLVRIYQAALGQVIASGPNPGVRIGDVPAEQDALRRGAEDAYRHLAAVTDDRNERIRLVDAANRVRPRTLV
jgi:serine/threonine-protein kinase PknG